MAYSLIGLGSFFIGFTLGAAVWGISSWIARKRAEAGFQSQLLRMKQEGIIRQQKMEEARREMIERTGGGAAMTERHKQVMEEELQSVLPKMPPMRRP